MSTLPFSVTQIMFPLIQYFNFNAIEVDKSHHNRHTDLVSLSTCLRNRKISKKWGKQVKEATILTN